MRRRRPLARTTSRLTIHGDLSSLQESAGTSAAQRAQIARKSAATNDAPPIRPPSISGCANNSRALRGLTLPPYRIRIARRRPRRAGQLRADAPRALAWACSGARGAAGADRPDRLVGDRAGDAGVPRTALQHGRHLARDHFDRAARLALAQRLADAHDRRQAGRQSPPALAATVSSFSAKNARRSEWPTITYSAAARPAASRPRPRPSRRPRSAPTGSARPAARRCRPTP